MGKARWATKNDIIKKLDSIDLKGTVTRSGVPIAYDDNFLYIDSREAHNLIIGSTGSGKTQTIILPMIKLSMLAGESIVVNDPKGELYTNCAANFKERGYNVLALNFDDAKLGNSWNPLKMPYDLYINGEKDKAVKELEDIGYYLFFDSKEKDSDPFWINSTINYFTGIVLYLFENADVSEIHLESVIEFSNYLNKKGNSEKILDKIDNTGLIYLNLIGTLAAPPETRGSIVSVFNQKMKKYVSRENLSNMLSSSDFELKDISNEPTALFIVSGVSNYCDNLIPLLINQIIDYVSIDGKQERFLNILLDEFDGMVPIKDFAKIIENCRSMKTRITVTIRSYIHLCNMYSKEDAIILKMCFGNLIYLLCDDIYTLDEISKYCGIKEDGEKLITIEELKTINCFDGIVLMPRTMPFKTTFLPDYKIEYSFSNKTCNMPKRNINSLKIYKEK